MTPQQTVAYQNPCSEGSDKTLSPQFLKVTKIREDEIHISLTVRVYHDRSEWHCVASIFQKDCDTPLPTEYWTKQERQNIDDLVERALKGVGDRYRYLMKLGQYDLTFRRWLTATENEGLENV